MDNQEIQFLQHRLLQLERRRRVLMGLILSGVMLIIPLLISLTAKAASQSVILRGQGLQILDAKGRPRIELKVDGTWAAAKLMRLQRAIIERQARREASAVRAP
jgi:hypothetical protein